ncbi:hypothetical protein EAD98_26890 [Micromonospora sp. CV4]|nr:hypothetical protein EAD98_26890 [Micromonospora sp. CV4]
MTFADVDGFALGVNRSQYASTSSAPPAAVTSFWNAGVRSDLSRCSGFLACQARHSPCNWPAGAAPADGVPVSVGVPVADGAVVAEGAVVADGVPGVGSPGAAVRSPDGVVPTSPGVGDGLLGGTGTGSGARSRVTAANAAPAVAWILSLIHL